jgi:hypothetical protein
MKRSWQVSRTVVPHDDGQRRWDYAYQFLLKWAMVYVTDAQSVPSHQQEDQHGNRSVCSCIDGTATANADHRATDGSSASACDEPAELALVREPYLPR